MELSALYLLACQVRVTVGNPGLRCCVCVTSFERWLTPLCVDSARALWASFCFIFIFVCLQVKVSPQEEVAAYRKSSKIFTSTPLQENWPSLVCKPWPRALECPPLTPSRRPLREDAWTPRLALNLTANPIGWETRKLSALWDVRENRSKNRRKTDWRKRKPGWIMDFERCYVDQCRGTRENSKSLFYKERERERENSNSKTLFYKDCSLGSFKNLSNN